MAQEGDLDQVDARLPSPGSSFDAWDMACPLDAVAETADHDVALALAGRAETPLDTGGDLDHDILLRSVTLLLAWHGHVERARALADRLDPDLREGRQAEIVGELARCGDTVAAEALAHSINDRGAQARALIEVARELARHGDPGRAEAVAHRIDDRWAQGEALVAVVRELARHGDPGRAGTLAQAIVHRATRPRALTALAELSAPSHARRLAAQVVVLEGWAAVLPVLELVVPGAVAVVVDQLTNDRRPRYATVPDRTSPRSAGPRHLPPRAGASPGAKGCQPPCPLVCVTSPCSSPLIVRLAS